MGVRQSTAPSVARRSDHGYTLRHPALLEVTLEEIVHPALWQALRCGTKAIQAVARCEFEDVYSIPLLQACVCTKLREEAEAFRAWAEKTGFVSPGLLLSARWYFKHMDPRYDAFFDRLVDQVLNPIDAALYSSEAKLAYHHDYCICYEEGSDNKLKPHNDDTDVTINIYLGATTGLPSHEGSDLLLLDPTDEDIRCGSPRLDDSYQGKLHAYQHEEIGRAVIHPGDRWHAVKPIVSGSRWNLLMWTLRDDSDWKQGFYQEMEERLRAKASKM